MVQRVVLYDEQKYIVGSSPTDFIFPLFSGKSKKGNYVFASVRAGDVNGYDSLLYIGYDSCS